MIIHDINISSYQMPIMEEQMLASGVGVSSCVASKPDLGLQHQHLAVAVAAVVVGRKGRKRRRRSWRLAQTSD